MEVHVDNSVAVILALGVLVFLAARFGHRLSLRMNHGELNLETCPDKVRRPSVGKDVDDDATGKDQGTT